MTVDFTILHYSLYNVPVHSRTFYSIFSCPSRDDFRRLVQECSIYYAIYKQFSLLLSLLNQPPLFTVLVSVSFRICINQRLQSVVSTHHRIRLQEVILVFLVYLFYYLIINLKCQNKNVFTVKLG